MELIYEKQERIARFVLNRPEALNALSPDLFRSLHEAFEDFSRDPKLRVGVVTGSGNRAFCAGADVKTWLPFVKECKERPWLLPTTPMRGMEMVKPLIAAVNGVAVGGGLELCLACDIRIAATEARFAAREAKIGIMPRLGGTVRLPRIIGQSRAASMLLTGRFVGAEEALQMGLVNEVVATEDLIDSAMKTAGEICSCAPLAVQAIKQTIRRTEGMSLEEALWCENQLAMPLYDTEDYEEGRKAFSEKRRPVFHGR